MGRLLRVGVSVIHLTMAEASLLKGAAQAYLAEYDRKVAKGGWYGTGLPALRLAIEAVRIQFAQVEWPGYG